MKRFCIAALFSLAATAAAATTPAPAHAQRLAAPAPSPVRKTSAKKAEPLTGFQDIKWGDSAAKATKILEAKGATVEKVAGSENVLRVGGLKVAGYETRDLTLRFGSEGFYQASVDFFSPRAAQMANLTTVSPYDDMRLIISERFGEPTQDRIGGGGFSVNSTYATWSFDRSNKEAATLTLTTNSSGQNHLEYRATDRAEREEGRIRSEKAKSL